MKKWSARLGACAAVAAGAMAFAAGPSMAKDPGAGKGDVVSIVKEAVCDPSVAAARLCIWQLPSQ